MLRFFALLPLLLAACEPTPSPPVLTSPPEVQLPATVKRLEPEAAAAWIQAHPQAVVLDVREDWEIAKEGRIAGALWADYLNDERFAQATGSIDPATPCLIYCTLGGRSALAAEKLVARGFKELSLLDGGWEGWLRAGKPVQKP